MKIRPQYCLLFLIALIAPSLSAADAPIPPASTTARSVTFDGKISTFQWALRDLNPNWPTDWTNYKYLVLEMRTSSPQRFSLWAYTADGPRRIEIQPFGQGVWLRAAVPLQYFISHDLSGNDLASATNRKYGSFWISVWGPYGSIKNMQAIGVTMFYPINKPTLEIRSMTLTNDDPGSVFLSDSGATLSNNEVTDPFRQWGLTDWTRKIKSAEQLQQELADEEKTLTPTGFNYDKFGGYADTQAKATGFFRVEKINDQWWFVDPDGHLFICQSLNGLGGGGGGARRGGGAAPATPNLQTRRLEAWGFNTGAANTGMPYIARYNAPRSALWLGLPDVYDENFAAQIDQAAATQCGPHKDDPLLVGYFVGNEPPWSERESEVCDLILQGQPTATQAKLKEFLAAGDTKERRAEFVVTAFENYLKLIIAGIKKYDPNHMTLGIRFGGDPTDAIMRTGRLFDVCSINVYEYEPTKQVKRAYDLTGRPILIGEFHIGVPSDGLGAGLVQAKDQVERGKAYRYFVEQAIALPGCVGAHWFTWQDEPVLGRGDGENYNIGFVDADNRAYPELVSAAQATHRQLEAVHSGKTPPFAQRPLASDAGTPDTAWAEQKYLPVYTPPAPSP
ncbi:MAG TPA: hypothetical protein VK737_02000 [Opitutales bacterium]|jgi:hypothetical protein|nr:hypothetical protein [Opitutales bacterium]